MDGGPMNGASGVAVWEHGRRSRGARERCRAPTQLGSNASFTAVTPNPSTVAPPGR
jgi:hypothetical protein